MKKLLLFLFISSSLTAEMTKDQSDFFDNLKPYCGKSFEGKVIFPKEMKDDDPFKGKRLVMKVETCTDKEIRIPFYVGEDKSRTWILSIKEKGLLLKHDHRHADGAPDDITMYGGWASKGTSYRQDFPADDYTANLIPAAKTNVWTLTLKSNTFSYILKRDGNMRFQADFDLKNPIN